MSSAVTLRAVVTSSATAMLWISSVPSNADPVKLPAGMSIPLELQHHVNSAYTPTGSPIYFRVARDVVVDGQALVAKGSLVTGKMQQAQERGMVGKSGAMQLDVRQVEAVDGTVVPVEADLSKQGRSRAGAAVAWTLFWGVPGLITRGVNPYLEKGTEILATVLTESAIDPGKPAELRVSPTAELTAQISGHRWGASGKNPTVTFDIERKTDLKTIAFVTAIAGQAAGSDASLLSMELIAVDGVPVPETVRAMQVVKGTAVFDGWSITRYCHDGTNSLTLGGVDGSGKRFAADYQLRVKVQKKG